MEPVPRPASKATEFLASVLVDDPAYRSVWQRCVVQRSSRLPNRAAVARVIAEHLIASGERADSSDLHRMLKDRVGRALGSGGLSVETARWFIEAFDFDDEDADRLRALLDHPGGATPPVWRPALRGAMARQGGRTTALHELHVIGPDGVPSSHRTVQVLRAEVDGLASHLYRFDTNVVEVTVLRGGTAGPIVDLGEGLFGVDIALAEPLPIGHTASLEYLTVFSYTDPPPPEMRRGVGRRVDALEIRVEFHPARLPAAVWWSAWEALDGPPDRQEEVKLDTELAVHRYVKGAEQAIVGFTWDWEQGNG